MNIKRMAEEYRTNTIETGKEIKKHFRGVLQGKAQCSIDSLHHRVGCWKSSLKNNMGGDLTKLIESLEIICSVQADIKKNKKPWERVITSEHISQIKIAEKKFNEFRKVLPELLEQALTKAVRESGIRL